MGCPKGRLTPFCQHTILQARLAPGSQGPVCFLMQLRPGMLMQRSQLLPQSWSHCSRALDAAFPPNDLHTTGSVDISGCRRWDRPANIAMCVRSQRAPPPSLRVRNVPYAREPQAQLCSWQIRLNSSTDVPTSRFIRG